MFIYVDGFEYEMPVDKELVFEVDIKKCVFACSGVVLIYFFVEAWKFFIYKGVDFILFDFI